MLSNNPHDSPQCTRTRDMTQVDVTVCSKLVLNGTKSCLYEYFLNREFALRSSNIQVKKQVAGHIWLGPLPRRPLFVSSVRPNVKGVFFLNLQMS